MKARARRRSRQGIFPLVIKPAGSEEVTARAGLVLVAEAFRALHLDRAVEEQLLLAKRQRGYTETEKVEALLLLIAAGGDRIEDIRILADDKGLLRMLERTLPSPDALLKFLAAFDDATLWAARPAGEASFVPAESGALRGLDAVNRALVARATQAPTQATIDHDGTIIESHKRAAHVAYEGTRGYQPLLAVWAEQDLIVSDEFRDGHVPAGKDPLPSVERAFAALPKSVTRRFFRGDSADYHTAVLKYLVAEGIGFTISADMGKELKACCLAVPEGEWKKLEERGGETVHVAEIEFTPGHWAKQAQPLRYVAVRFTPRQRDAFGEAGPKHLAVVSNRRDLAAGQLVRWHWEKAGTIEHVHRVLKDELGAGVMPSNKFGANAAWLRLNVLTANLLTVLKRQALPERLWSARPKRLRFEVFTVPGRLTVHQRQLSVSISASAERIDEMVSAREKLLALYEAPAIPAGAT